MSTTKNFAEYIQRKLDADPKLAAEVAKERAKFQDKSNPTHVGYSGELVQLVKRSYGLNHGDPVYVVYRFNGNLYRCLEKPTWLRDYTPIRGGK